MTSSRDVRPVHVEFYRCGRQQPGGGWTRCKTAHLCQYHGCQVMQAVEMRERERERAGGGSVSTDIDQRTPSRRTTCAALAAGDE